MSESETQANAVCFTHTSHITSVKLLCDHLLVQCWVIANHHESKSPHHAKIAAQIFLCAGDEFQHTHSAVHQISPVRCWFGPLVRYVQGPGKKSVVGLVRQLRVSCSQCKHLCKYTRPNRIHKLLGRQRNHLFFNKRPIHRQVAWTFLSNQHQRQHT